LKKPKFIFFYFYKFTKSFKKISYEIFKNFLFKSEKILIFSSYFNNIETTGIFELPPSLYIFYTHWHFGFILKRIFFYAQKYNNILSRFKIFYKFFINFLLEFIFIFTNI
jgi:hypothetical protein